MFNFVFGPATLGALPVGGSESGAVCVKVIKGVSK
jgi:hypothetical protein